MADITLTVDATSLTDAGKKLRDFGAAVNKFSVLGLTRGINSLQSNIRELVTAQRQGTIGSSAYQLGLLEVKRAYEQMGYSSQAATAAVRRYAAELQRQEAARLAAEAAKALARAQQEAAAAAKVLADRQTELRRRFQEGYALFERQRQAMRDLREAYRANIITLAQYQAQLAQIRAGNLTGHINQQSQGLNRMAVLTQQAGYQFGDFFVQIQSGTNVFVAFGQQATQIIGTLAALSTSLKAIALFSGLGVLVAIGTGIGAYLMRTSGASKTLKDNLSGLKEVSTRLKDSFRALQDEGLSTTFGNMTTSVKSLTQALLNLDASSQMKTLQRLLSQMKSQAEVGFFGKVGVGAKAFVTQGSIGAFANYGSLLEEQEEKTYQKLGLSMARAQFFTYQKNLMILAKSGNREGVAKLMENVINDATDFGAATDNISLQGAELLQQMGDAAKAIAESAALLNGSADDAERLVQAEKSKLEYSLAYYESLKSQQAAQAENAAAVQELVSLRDNELGRLGQEIGLLELISAFGRDSLEVRNREAEIARETYQQEQYLSGIKGNNLDLVMKQYDSSQDLLKSLVNQEAKIVAIKGGMSAVLAEIVSSKNAMVAMVATAPSGGWLSGAISDAGTLASKLWDAASAAAAAQNAKPSEDKMKGAYGLYGFTRSNAPSEPVSGDGIGGTSGSSGGGGAGNAGLESLLTSLQTEREVIEGWYAESQTILQTASDAELQIIGGRNEAKLRLEQEYQEKLKGIRDAGGNTALGDAATFFGGMADIARAGGDKTVKAMRIFSAAQALINSYVAFTEVLKDPSFIGRPWARFGAAASALSGGLSAVAAIKGGGSGGGGSISRGSASVSTASAAPAPQTVFIDSLDPDGLYSGQALINLFDAFYDENDKRGKVFVVAR